MDNNIKTNYDLNVLCDQVKTLIYQQKYNDCKMLITEAMKNYPHAPEPHNFLGILLETQGNHLMAMKHFRASWALDPTYIPARSNLECYGNIFSQKRFVFCEEECKQEKKDLYKVMYDNNGIGHVKRR